jgi:hypothetical protein
MRGPLGFSHAGHGFFAADDSAATRHQKAQSNIYERPGLLDRPAAHKSGPAAQSRRGLMKFAAPWRQGRVARRANLEGAAFDIVGIPLADDRRIRALRSCRYGLGEAAV